MFVGVEGVIAVMLVIKCSPTFKPEREYICQVLLTNFLGLDYIIKYEDCPDWCISVEDGANILLPDIFFQIQEQQWLTSESLPRQPLDRWNIESCDFDCQLVSNKVPVIYGNLDFGQQIPVNHERMINNSIIPLDIFGSAFFMLSRYEELVKKERDLHDRFPGTASLAFHEGFLDRPIINEYLEVLWAGMKRLCPGLERKKRNFQMRVTCDVDHVHQEGLISMKKQIRTIGGDLLLRRNPKLSLKSTLNYFTAKFGNFSFDSYLSALYWILDVNEKAGNRVAFYFKAGKTDPLYDSAYCLDEPVVRKLLHDIHDRGHEIALHPSYNTYQNDGQLKKEADNLRRVLKEEGVRQDSLGSRQHYLRWDATQTPDHLDSAGFTYDTTGSYADMPGFRYGTATPFPMWGWLGGKKLSMLQRPLIVMECSVIAPSYMGMGYSDKSLDFMLLLRDRAILFGGDFTLLWHNTHLISGKDREFFEKVVS